MTFWSDACSKARSRMLTSQNDVYVMNGILIASFIACAVVQACALWRWRQKWRQTSAERMSSGWLLHEGQFIGLACTGSVFGALAYGARMGNMLQIYASIKLEQDLNISANSTDAELLLIEREYSTRHKYASAFYFLFPWEVALVVFAKLLVLKRMRDFALSVNSASVRRMWIRVSRVFVAVVVAGNIIGICSNFASGVWFSESAQYSDKAVQAWSSNNSAAGRDFMLQAKATMQRAARNNSIQRFSEATILLLVVSAFLAVGARSFSIISSAVRNLFIASVKVKAMTGAAGDQTRQLVAQASEQGRLLRLKIVLTFVIVFATVLLRSAFYVLYAVASALQNTGDPCGLTCDPCRNDFSHIHDWILYTPVLQQVVMLIASPLMMLVALWGMSDVQELEDMNSAKMKQLQNCSKNNSMQPVTPRT